MMTVAAVLGTEVLLAATAWVVWGLVGLLRMRRAERVTATKAARLQVGRIVQAAQLEMLRTVLESRADRRVS